MTFVFAQLQNWLTGATRPVRSDSEVVQWVLDADWFNWGYEQRREITRDVEASPIVWLTPWRLGVHLRYPAVVDNQKISACCFIQLYDTRIMKPDCFRIQTYSEWFADFCKNIESEDESDEYDSDEDSSEDDDSDDEYMIVDSDCSE